MTKPNIEQLYAAFQTFQVASVRAGYRQELLDKAREAFKAKMAEFGLADMIDWTDPNGAELVQPTQEPKVSTVNQGFKRT